MKPLNALTNIKVHCDKVTLWKEKIGFVDLCWSTGTTGKNMLSSVHVCLPIDEAAEYRPNHYYWLTIRPASK